MQVAIQQHIFAGKNVSHQAEQFQRSLQFVDGNPGRCDRQLGAVLDFVVVTRKPVTQDVVVRGFRPLDDVDELAWLQMAVNGALAFDGDTGGSSGNPFRARNARCSSRRTRPSLQP